MRKLLAAVAGGIGLLSLLPAARANSIIVVNLNSISDANQSIVVGGTTYEEYTFDYTIGLTQFNAMTSPGTEGFTIRDFNGYVFNSASFTSAVSGTTWSQSQTLTGLFGTVGSVDDPTMMNINETLTAGTVSNPTSSTLVLGDFKANSIYSTAVLPSPTLGPIIGGQDDAGANGDPYPGPQATPGGPTIVGAPVPASALSGMALLALVAGAKLVRTRRTA